MKRKEKFDGRDFVLAICAYLNEKQVRDVYFEPSSYAEEADIPFCKKLGGPIDTVAVSLAAPGCIDISVCKDGEILSGAFNGTEDEDFEYLFNEVYYYLCEVNEPEAEEWMEGRMNGILGEITPLKVFLVSSILTVVKHIGEPINIPIPEKVDLFGDGNLVSCGTFVVETNLIHAGPTVTLTDGNRVFTVGTLNEFSEHDLIVNYNAVLKKALEKSIADKEPEDSNWGEKAVRNEIERLHSLSVSRFELVALSERISEAAEAAGNPNISYCASIDIGDAFPAIIQLGASVSGANDDLYYPSGSILDTLHFLAENHSFFPESLSEAPLEDFKEYLALNCDEIFEQIEKDIAGYIEEYRDEDNAGKEDSVTCPFCESSKVVIDEADGRYHCTECDRLFDDDDIRREELRHRLSPKLSDTSEEEPLQVDIPIGKDGRIIDSVFLFYDGTMWFRLKGEDEYKDIDELDIDDLEALVSGI